MLLEAGALSVTYLDALDQPLYEPGPGETPLWDNIRLLALFPGDTPESNLTKLLGNQPNAPLEFETTLLDDQAWERAWLKDFKPLCFANKLWICPQGMEMPDEDGIKMILDPGLAFGTGTHPTTALCLDWLASNHVNGQQLIDYGCGSGILAIAALMLQADKVLGVDNDPQALQASRENARKNAIEDTDFPLFLPGDFAKGITEGEIGAADGVLANILAAPLVELATYLKALVKPGGFLLLSGILESQIDDILSAYEVGFTISAPKILDGWVRIEAIKNS